MLDKRRVKSKTAKALANCDDLASPVTSSTTSPHSDESQSPSMDPLLDPYMNFGTKDISIAVKQNCECCIPQHITVFDPSIPIMADPNVVVGSYEEVLTCARSLCGKWVTMLERSDSLDDQMKHVGIGKLKRIIMNRLAVPLDIFLEKEDSILHTHLLTPLGIRHMVCDLHGGSFVDEDPDAGQWEGTARMVNYSIPW
eukprot:Lankesteria_metandrocarpae@DN4953_c0_g1_i4.p1